MFNREFIDNLKNYFLTISRANVDEEILEIQLGIEEQGLSDEALISHINFSLSYAQKCSSELNFHDSFAAAKTAKACLRALKNSNYHSYPVDRRLEFATDPIFILGQIIHRLQRSDYYDVIFALMSEAETHLQIKINEPITYAYPERRNTLLHLMIANEEHQPAEFLLEAASKFINPNAKDCEGKTSLILAVKMLSGPITKLLLTHKFKDELQINTRDNDGRTALHYAIALGRPDIVEMLVLYGADLHVVDNNNHSPSDMINLDDNATARILESVGIAAHRDISANTNRLPNRQLYTKQNIKNAIDDLAQCNDEESKSMLNYYLELYVELYVKSLGGASSFLEICDERGQLHTKQNIKNAIDNLVQCKDEVSKRKFNYYLELYVKSLGASFLDICKQGKEAVMKYLSSLQTEVKPHEVHTSFFKSF